MSDIGIEVGQKMRSAIKAKLTELDCYVDDELPDYIMVMIANKRTKSQMKDDLQLFLSSKTSTFVEWLHIVLKKLKEVHVTNPDVFKKPTKRKSSDLVITEEEMKKIKKEKKEEAKALKKARKDAKASKELQKSLTDDLPITANKLSEARKIVVMKENQMAQSGINDANNIDEDNFDIPLLSEISASNEEELELIEKKIKNVKSRLGLQVESDDEDCLNIKPDPDDLLLNEQLKKSKDYSAKNNARKISVDELKSDESNDFITNDDINVDRDIHKRSVHTRITFDKEKDSLNAKYAKILNKRKEDNQNKKKSILQRLGKRPNDIRSTLIEKKLKINVDKINRSKEKNQDDIRQRLNNRLREKDRREPEEGILSRLGVMSKVSVPTKRPKTPEEEINDEEEQKMTQKEVPSIVKIKVKPRVLPPKTKQANPNLLLKAVAEAQRSVSRTKTVGNSTNAKATETKVIQKPDTTAFFTKKYKENLENKLKKAKLLERKKEQLNVLLNTYLSEEAENETEENLIYKTKPVEPDSTIINYSKNSLRSEENGSSVSQKFIVTLDGIENTKFASPKEDKKTIVKIKRTPSPIVFDKPKAKIAIIPDKLPVVHPPPALKNKERCKYWPGCRQAEKCEFVHPSAPCKMFPNCKFEDKCLYIHPVCKFESSCTRRDCPYSHTGKNASRLPPAASSGTVQKSPSQICKYFPNCSNSHCSFYHPRLCKFGTYCNNQLECNFVHSFPTKPGHLVWRPEHK